MLKLTPRMNWKWLVTLKIGDLIRAPLIGLAMDDTRSDWEGKVGTVIGFSNEDPELVKVMLQETGLFYSFHKDTLVVLSEGR